MKHPRRTPPPSTPESRLRAQKRMMDYVAARDHSEKELRQKLKAWFAPEDVESAIEYGKLHRWIPQTIEDNQNLSARMAQGLHRKSKGWIAINHKLQEKGLPPLARNEELELEKAKSLIQSKYKSVQSFDLKTRAKMMRFLMSRGFDNDTIRKTLAEYFS